MFEPSKVKNHTPVYKNTLLLIIKHLPCKHIPFLGNFY